MIEWTREEAENYYRIPHWGKDFFGINNMGNLSVYPEKRTDGPRIDISEIVSEMKNQNISLPAVIRFHDILRYQVEEINQLFNRTIEEAEYNGRYFGVYPIKVNQMREVVEEIIDAGADYDYGLEAGSKTELMSVLALNENKNSLTVLNGYKDEEYMKLALLGLKLGRKVFVVIEKYSELKLLVNASKEMNIKPLIGFRAKLDTVAGGKWTTSSGDKAKFGLTTAEILRGVDFLRNEGLESSLRLFHYHIGSQIPDIRSIKEAINEGSRIFCKLQKLGVPLEYFDVGGGLGVDYEGSKGGTDSSINYEMSEYISDVIYSVKQTCDMEGVPHPNIVTESGRAITARHSCVVVNVFDKIEMVKNSFNTESVSGEHLFVENMREAYGNLDQSNLLETFNDVDQYKREAMSAFKLGVIDLREKAVIETIYWKTLQKIQQMSIDVDLDQLPEDIKNLDKKLASKYLCNFSVFQSLPDTWAIDQLLPILPLERLNEKPTVHTTLADITCDSDGKVDKFIGQGEMEETLLLHDLKEDEEYNLGIFMTGAYQDVMGDNHNLLGRLNEVHVYCDDEDPKDFYIEETIYGVTSRKVLQTMQYNDQSLASSVKKVLDKQIKAGNIQPREGVKLIDFYERCLRGYTYLKHK
ncbi:MAG: biosynthetic arginine decarboxylase [Bacteriovoracaceae bacterium]|nr:biosynthetic arginine decarboxylase [Bacteriovoracaceae bacterium]